MSKLNRLLSGILLAVFVMGVAFGQTELIGEDFSSAPVDWVNGSFFPTTTAGELYYAEEKKNVMSIVTIAVTDPDWITFDFKTDKTAGYKGAFTVKYSTSQSGPFSLVWATATPASTSYASSGTEFPGAAGTYYLQLERVNGANDLFIDNFIVTQSIVVGPTTLTGFITENERASSEQWFSVSGANLTDDISITLPTNYEISEGTGALFSAATNPITFTPSSNTVTAKTIYVRLKSGLTEKSYNDETITISSTDKISKTVTFSGDVRNAIVPSISSLTGFAYEPSNGPSTEKSFTVSGQDLTANITLTPPTNYEISEGTGGAFSAENPITLTEGGGTVAETTIYVRLKSGLSEASYNGEDITISSTGKISKTVTCSGDVSQGIVLNTSSLSDFKYVQGSGPSAEQSFTVSGADLTANIIITPPTNYEISTGTSGSFSATNPITLTESGGTVAETTIYVRLKAGLSEAANINETITLTSDGKISKTVTCSGDVVVLILNIKVFVEGALW